ncbi:MAG: hypothetical protein H6766_01035 [Candidatus Peribacteria bacterium]|nr:MAG: hypothetical protein H6766_01035 [Candidatus Peribacteria bacterium]
MGSLLDVIDDDRRGTLITYDFDGSSESALQTCTPNLLNNGAYCVSDINALYNVTKAGLE